jgi:hypothetical protein
MKKMTKAQKKGEKIMKEWTAGELNIGKSKKMVPSGKKGQAQAVAIMLSQMGKSRKK